MKGVDYSSGHPGGAALKAAGIGFAARYVSHTPSKNISAVEATDLAAHGVWTVLVWETTANRAGAGRAAGIADAHDALAQATAAGMPPGRPLYFAVDWDANPAVVVPYFQGVASVLGLARTGVYGGFKVVSYLLDHQLAAWAWQTAAWSAGRWDPRAHIRQPATTVQIGGVACDNDTSQQTDFGQWMPGGITPLEDDVALTPDQTKALAMLPQVASDTAALRANLLHIGSLDEKDAKGAPVEHAAGYYLAHAFHDTSGAIWPALVKMSANLAALQAAVGALAQGGGITAEQIKAAAEAGAQAALAELGDALKPLAPTTD